MVEQGILEIMHIIYIVNVQAVNPVEVRILDGNIPKKQE
jgi:hypothetical protein